MIIIDISIEDIDNLYRLGAIRLKPKHTPNMGEICTYEYGNLDNHDRLIHIGKFEFPYGDALKLTTKIIEEYNNVNITISSLSTKSIN